MWAVPPFLLIHYISLHATWPCHAPIAAVAWPRDLPGPVRPLQPPLLSSPAVFLIAAFIPLNRAHPGGLQNRCT